jgi:hypothetical protein
MDVKSINNKKEVGDFRVVSKMIGRTTEACRIAWRRQKGKPFEEVKVALEKIIESRQILLRNK